MLGQPNEVVVDGGTSLSAKSQRFHVRVSPEVISSRLHAYSSRSIVTLARRCVESWGIMSNMIIFIISE